jgi:hypothetical protein
MSRIGTICTPLDGPIHCAGIRYMNSITYTPGESLSQLESTTLSAPYQGWEPTFRLNVLASYFLTARLFTLLGEAAAKGEGRGLAVPVHAGKYRAWCMVPANQIHIWYMESPQSRVSVILNFHFPHGAGTICNDSNLERRPPSTCGIGILLQLSSQASASTE